MKKIWLILSVLAVIAFAYSSFEDEAQSTATAPTLPLAVSRPIVEVAPTIAPLYPSGTVRESLPRPGVKKKLQVSFSKKIQPKPGQRPGVRQELPRSKFLPLLPRPGTDVGKKENKLNYELGENLRDIEERNSMRARSHQELKQYRLLAVQYNF
jgi:hypothetical protein